VVKMLKSEMCKKEKGAKACLFEGGIRVPAIISWPDKIPEDQVRDQFVVNTDWLPLGRIL